MWTITKSNVAHDNSYIEILNIEKQQFIFKNKSKGAKTMKDELKYIYKKAYIVLSFNKNL